MPTHTLKDPETIKGSREIIAECRQQDTSSSLPSAQGLIRPTLYHSHKLSYAEDHTRLPHQASQEVIKAWGTPSHASAEGASNTLKTGGACVAHGHQRSLVAPSDSEVQGLSAASASERAQQGNLTDETNVLAGNRLPTLQEQAHANSTIDDVSHTETTIERAEAPHPIEKTGSTAGNRLPTSHLYPLLR